MYRHGYVGDCNRAVCGSFLVAKTPRPALGTTQFGWVPGHFILPWVKRPGREAGHSPTSDAKVQNKWSYTSTPLMCLNDVYRGKLSFFVPFAVCVNLLFVHFTVICYLCCCVSDVCKACHFKDTVEF